MSDIRRPLHRLSELFEGATKALVIRHDDKTLVATFSLAAMPKPVRIQKEPYKPSTTDYEWLEHSGLSGWFIPDVNNPSLAAIECVPDDIYSHCMELTRYTNSCPCPMQATGECDSKYLYPNVPEGFSVADMQTDYLIDRTVLKRVRYKKLSDFELTSGGLTNAGNFAKAMRPWDDHEFQHVSSRRLELSARGHARHVRAKFRKAQCSKCCFVTEHYDGEIHDCGCIEDCKEPTDATTAWALLFYWYEHCGFEPMEGFTNAQRDYLIQAAGDELLVQAIASRRTKTILGGFVRGYNVGRRRDCWFYRLSAAGGDIQRSKDVECWKDLKEIIPGLPDKPKPDKLSSKTKLACAILGSQKHGITELYKKYYPIYKITVNGGGVEASGAATRYESTSLSLHTDKYESVKDYYHAVRGWRFSEAPKKARYHLTTV